MNRTLVRLPLLVASGAAAVATLAACSSSGSSSPSTTASAPSQQAAGSGTSVTATETEFHIALSSTSLKPGTYTFDVKNAGKITHALSINGPGVANKSTGDLSAGDSKNLTVTLEAGSYDVYCPVGDHKMEGMDETVKVG